MMCHDRMNEHTATHRQSIAYSPEAASNHDGRVTRVRTSQSTVDCRSAAIPDWDDEATPVAEIDSRVIDRLDAFDTERIQFRSPALQLPPRDDQAVNCVFVNAKCTEKDALSPPLGHLYLAAQLRRECPDVSSALFDFEAMKTPNARACDRIVSCRPQMVVFTYTTFSWRATCELAAMLREKLPNVVLVVGGRHVSARDVPVAAYQLFDYIVRGEGETITREIARHLGRVLINQRRTRPLVETADVLLRAVIKGYTRVSLLPSRPDRRSEPLLGGYATL